MHLPINRSAAAISHPPRGAYAPVATGEVSHGPAATPWSRIAVPIRGLDGAIDPHCVCALKK